MSGPLHTLRAWLRDNATIDESTPGVLQVGDVQLSLKAQTEYRQKRGSGAPYTLDSIWALYFYVQVQGRMYSDYVKACKEINVFPCIFQDKTEISEWLIGTRPPVHGIVAAPIAPAPAPAPAAAPSAPLPALSEAQSREAELPKRPEASMELTIAPSAPLDEGGTVEYETLRPLDSVLLCGYDFSEMANRRNVLESTDRTKRLAADDPNRRLDGQADDSFFGRTKQVPLRRFREFVILVSMSPISRINNTNVEKFLGDGEWVPPSVDQTREWIQLTHRHSLTAAAMKYDIVANERLMKPDDWNFVVAVFLIGANWQIRTYVPNDPSALLSKVLGIYVGWDHEPIPPPIARWKVKEYKISKNARHGDYQVVQNIWHDVEDATAALKKKR
jgi:hypothetical protein